MTKRPTKTGIDIAGRLQLKYTLWSRPFRLFWQRLTRGWSDDELWNLDRTISKFVLPRLKAFRDRPFGRPAATESIEQWQAELDEMIFAFEFDPNADIESPEWQADYERAQKGMALFAERYWHLWQ